MRIGIDCRTILNSKSSERAGVAHYSYYLLKHILEIDKNNEYILFLSHGQTLPKELFARNVKVVNFSKKIFPFIHSHYSVAQEIKNQHLNIYHSLSGILPLFFKGKSIITVADLSMYVNPQWFSPKKIFGDFFWRKILIPKSIKKANRIIAVSENTKKDILRFFPIQEKKILVIHNGLERENISDNKVKEVLEKFNLIGKKYFLFIGTVEPRKNIINIIKAFEEFLYTPHPSARGGHPLPQGEREKSEGEINKEEYFFVIAGGLGWKYEPMLDAIKNSTVNSQIKYIGYISAEEKISLLKNTLCFVWPSLYEGFGLPILEAMACGAPVITSNTSSIPEVAGNASIMIDPNDMPALSQAMARVAHNENEQKKLRLLGIERVKSFSWEKTSQETLEAYIALGNKQIY